MKLTLRAITLLMSALWCALAPTYAGSSIDTTVPVQGAPFASAPIRSNFTKAASDINALQSRSASPTQPPGLSNFQDWASTAGCPTACAIYMFDGTLPVQWGTLNQSTHVFSAALGSPSISPTAPITASFSGGVATIGVNIDGNFAVSGGNLAFAPIASGDLLANCTGSMAEPTLQTWSACMDINIGASNGMLPLRAGGVWGSVALGTSITNPGTGTLESVLAVQTVTGSSKAFATADLFKKTRRSNSGSAMTDTFPASSATGMVSGTRIVIANTDATATLTITAGAGTVMASGGFSDTIGPGRDIAYEYDLANTQWRRAYNTGTALLGPNNLSDIANAATARANLGVTATGADTTYAYRANNLSDLASASAARGNLGLGNIATQNAGTGLAISGSNLNLQPASAGTIGGVNSIAAVSHNWVSYIDTAGLPHLNQPGFSDLSGSLAPSQCPNATTSATGCVEGDNASLSLSSGVISLNPAHSNFFTALQGVNLTGASLSASATGDVLDLAAASGVASQIQLRSYGATSSYSTFAYGGTAASPTAVTSGTVLGYLSAWAFNGAAPVGGIAAIEMIAAENITSGHQGSAICLQTTPIASTTISAAMCQQNDGGVTIGGPSKGSGTLSASAGLYSVFGALAAANSANQYGYNPTQLLITRGSSGTPDTDGTTMPALITQYSNHSSQPGDGSNTGTLTVNHDSYGSVQGVSIAGRCSQNGSTVLNASKDCVGVYGIAISNVTGSVNPYSPTAYAFSGTGQAAGPNTSIFGVQYNLANGTGTSMTFPSSYTNTTPIGIGVDVVTATPIGGCGAGCDLAAGLMVRGSALSGLWDTAIGIAAGSVRNSIIRDYSSAVTEFDDRGTHSYGYKGDVASYSVAALQFQEFILAGNGHQMVIGSPSNPSNSGLIQFHSSGNNINYDSQISSSGGNGSNGNGTLTVTAATIALPAVTTINGIQAVSTTATQTLVNKTLTSPTITGATITTSTYNGNTWTAGTGTLTLGAGKTATISNTMTLTAVDGSTLAIGAGGTLGSNAYTSTAYAPLASPTFTGTPVLNTATATSINKVAFTAPATGATLTIADGKTLTDTSAIGASLLLGATGGGFAVFSPSAACASGFVTALSANGATTCANRSAFSTFKFSNALSGNVALNNVSAFFDGPSVAQGSTGTWTATGSVGVNDTAGPALISCILWDGTTIVASAGPIIPAANTPVTVTLTGDFTSPAGNIRISCKDLSSTSGVILFNNSGSSKDANITVNRLD